MSESGSVSSHSGDELGPENIAQLERLRRVLTAVPGFQIVLLEAPEHPIRRTVIDRILSWGGAGEAVPLRHIVVDAGAAPENLIDRLEEARSGALVEGLDSLFVDDPSVDRSLGALNWYREQLRRLDGPLILVLSPRGVSALMARAPDFATWRSHTCRIRVPAPDRRVSPAFAAIFDTLPDPLGLDVAEAALEAARRGGAPRDTLVRIWLDVARARRRAKDDSGGDAAYARATELTELGVSAPTAARVRAARLADSVARKRWDDARAQLSAFDEADEAGAPPEAKAWFELARAEIAAQDNAWPRAAEHARHAVRLADASEVHAMRIAARLRLIAITSRFDDPTTLRQVAAELLSIAGTPSERALALRLMADFDVIDGRLDLALKSYRQALRVLGSAPATERERAEIRARVEHIGLLATAALASAAGEEAAQSAILAADANALLEADGDPDREQAIMERQLFDLARLLDGTTSLASDARPAPPTLSRRRRRRRRRA